MIDSRAFSLPKKLIRRFRTRDPFTIADMLGITVLMRNDFKRQKGAFVVVGNNSFIFINNNLSQYMQRLICAHELGHALLHRRRGAVPGGMLEFEIFDMTDQTEYDANVFASNLLIDEEEVIDLAGMGYDIVQIAREIGLNVNILLVKLTEMNKQGYQLNVPYTPNRRFLGEIEDNAGTL